MPRAWKVRTIVVTNPDWNDLFDTIAKYDVDGRDIGERKRRRPSDGYARP